MPGKNKIKRNAPCPCGSGKKYKNCCMFKDKAAQIERVAWERAAQDMRVALIGFAKEKRFVQDLATALGLFWQDRYRTETIHLMSVDESLRFFDWFAHDYTLAQEGRRLIELYRQEVDDALNAYESSTLDAWIAGLPGSAFVFKGADLDQGLVTLQDMFLTDRLVTVRDRAAATHGQEGQILLARPLPEHNDLRLSGATAVLPAEEKDALHTYMLQARQAYLADHPETTMRRFLRDRAYLFTHYALEWADREQRPALAADDPDARGQGGQAMKKLIKWSQERVQIR
jgi:uncharacterized protein